MFFEGKSEIVDRLCVKGFGGNIFGLKIFGESDLEKQIFCKSVDFGKTNSATTPGVCLAGALFFQKKHAPFQKNTYIGVLGVKNMKIGCRKNGTLAKGK